MHIDALNLFCTLEKLFLIAKGLDELLEDNYSILIHDTGRARKRTLCAVITGVSELRRDLEALTMADPLYLATDGLERSFPVDNTDDSGYDKHEISQ